MSWQPDNSGATARDFFAAKKKDVVGGSTFERRDSAADDDSGSAPKDAAASEPTGTSMTDTFPNYTTTKMPSWDDAEPAVITPGERNGWDMEPETTTKPAAEGWDLTPTTTTNAPFSTYSGGFGFTQGYTDADVSGGCRKMSYMYKRCGHSDDFVSRHFCSKALATSLGACVKPAACEDCYETTATLKGFCGRCLLDVANFTTFKPKKMALKLL